MRGLNQYLSDLIQYSIKPDITLVTNQYTAGNEFTVRQDNSDYIGYYHIMADGTIMDGADMATISKCNTFSWKCVSSK
jgi:hypothetical protein